MVKEKIQGALTRNNFVTAYRRIWPYAKPYWFRALLALLIAIPVGALDAVIAMFLKPYTDKVLFDLNATYIYKIPLAVVGFTVVQGILLYASAYLNAWLGSKISTNIGRDLYKKLLTLEPAYFDKTTSGHVVQRFCTDAFTASNTLITNLRMFISKVFSSIALIAVLFYNSWQLSLIAVAALLFAFAPLRYVRRKMKGVVTKSVVVNANAVTANNETFSGNKIIAGYNLQDYQNKKYDGIMDNTFNLSVKMVQYTNWLSPLMHIVLSVGIAGVIAYSSYLIMHGYITRGNFVSFLAAMFLLYTPIKTVGNNIIDIEKAILAIERIFEIFGLSAGITDKAGAKTISSIKKNIKFEGVTFEYAPDKPVLKDINLTVPVGQTVAFVGNSGGGKSTLVNLIPRFYDVQRGAVLIDGVNVKDITLKSLRSHMAVVFQDNFLFSGTIRENITLGNLDAAEEEIVNAVRNAHLADFIAGLPDGLDTVIGERGTTLSGGQKQRVAIARAFVRNASVVILDEATSALDNKSEAVVQKAIDNLMKNRTVFVIAHRLSTVQNADKIVVINEGRIVEAGSHAELLKNAGGPYHILYHAQFKDK
ncbi:MAG: ABC transporter ATP-binding protein/permease [Elusimicrobium sp.]|jgi:subfamily B ATP-binding cassette protein MsbA|nr:ABC transporter ATP-binding protein/permease [Elusimicrobium sp.]